MFQATQINFNLTSSCHLAKILFAKYVAPSLLPLQAGTVYIHSPLFVRLCLSVCPWPPVSQTDIEYKDFNLAFRQYHISIVHTTWYSIHKIWDSTIKSEIQGIRESP